MSCTSDLNQDNIYDKKWKDNTNLSSFNSIENPIIFFETPPNIKFNETKKITNIEYKNIIFTLKTNKSQSLLSIKIDNKTINKDIEVDFDPAYKKNIEFGSRKISLFKNIDDSMQILLLPTSSEEYPSYLMIPLNDSGIIHTYLIEIENPKCFDFNRILLNFKYSNIQVEDKDKSSCQASIFGEKIISKNDNNSNINRNNLLSNQLKNRYPSDLYKTYNYDINSDGISDKIISSINDDNNVFQGDELYVFLGNENDKYTLSLDTSNHTSDGGYFFSSILPRPTNSGFMSRTYFSSKGYPIKNYYYTYENEDWYISATTTEGYTIQDHKYYCIDNTITTVSEYNHSINASFNDDEELLQSCPPLPNKYIVTTEQADILDENFESRSTPNYYIKGDLIDALSQNEDWIKVSYKDGTKFGWVDKSNLRPTED